ncbi:MAG: ATP-binding protein [Candidatus Micrarchaeota archaeon]|nr:ATP-binding protein [Candidatus Micrarchaeota archaeon]
MNIILKTIRKLLKNEQEETAGFRLMLGDAVCSLVLKRGFTYRHGAMPRIESELNNSWKKRSGTIYIDPAAEANPHIIITGMSGFGKSTLFRSMLSDIRNAGLAAIVFDPHNEHSGTITSLGGYVRDASRSGINLLDLDGATVGERISELTALFRNTYSLGYIQATKLSECLWYTYRKFGAASRQSTTLKSQPTVKDLISELAVFINHSKSASETNTLVHLRDRLSLLNTPAFNRNAIGMESLSNGISSFSLSGMKSGEGRMIYITELLKRLYSTMHGKPIEHGVRLYIMIDEAQFLISNTDEGTEITKLIEEGRKYGVGVVVVTHAASKLNRQVTANASTFIAFYSREPQEIAYTSKLLANGDASRAQAITSRLARLGKHEAMVVSTRIRSPTVFRTILPERLEVVARPEVIDMGSLAERPIRLEELREAVGLTDDAPIDDAIISGQLSSFDVGRGPDFETWLMRPKATPSIEHEVYVSKIAAALDSIGVPNRIVGNANNPDLECRINGKPVAVEYETGTKSIEDTMGMIARRRPKYDTVIFVVNDQRIDKYTGIKDIRLFKASDVLTGEFSRRVSEQMLYKPSPTKPTDGGKENAQIEPPKKG